MNTHVDLCPSWQVKRHGAGKGHSAGKKAWRWKKRAWRWEKGAWRGAMLKGAGGNTSYALTKLTKWTHFNVSSLIFLANILFTFLNTELRFLRCRLEFFDQTRQSCNGDRKR